MKKLKLKLQKERGVLFGSGRSATQLQIFLKIKKCELEFKKESALLDGRFTINWKKKTKNQETTEKLLIPMTNNKKGVINFNEELSMNSTLLKLPNNQFEKKEYKIALVYVKNNKDKMFLRKKVCANVVDLSPHLNIFAQEKNLTVELAPKESKWAILKCYLHASVVAHVLKDDVKEEDALSCLSGLSNLSTSKSFTTINAQSLVTPKDVDKKKDENDSRSVEDFTFGGSERLQKSFCPVTTARERQKELVANQEVEIKKKLEEFGKPNEVYKRKEEIGDNKLEEAKKEKERAITERKSKEVEEEQEKKEIERKELKRKETEEKKPREYHKSGGREQEIRKYDDGREAISEGSDVFFQAASSPSRGGATAITSAEGKELEELKATNAMLINDYYITRHENSSSELLKLKSQLAAKKQENDLLKEKLVAIKKLQAKLQGNSRFKKKYTEKISTLKFKIERIKKENTDILANIEAACGKECAAKPAPFSSTLGSNNETLSLLEYNNSEDYTLVVDLFCTN
ncbi:uncharacterized protein LOC135146616 isoform X3 [Zophobas morio]|uniref:uncharacterized protein LOC135146616 isoform X3 n=1 Tax=Zophobas morio TaxID=2755281 RepID=UPI00308283CE